MTDKLTAKNILIEKAKIDSAVDSIASCIERDYKDKIPLLIGILKGSFVFLSDLARRLPLDIEIDFVKVASYGSGTCSSGQAKLLHDTSIDVSGRDVIVVEDIVDTGITTSFVCDYMKNRGAGTVRLCTLLNKPSRRQVDVKIDYEGITVPDKFIVGYGLDCAEKYRNLPAIYFIDEEKK